MSAIIILNTIALIASVLWIAFEPGFEPFIVTLTFVVTLIGLAIKASKNNKEDINNSSVGKQVEQKVNSLTEVQLVASRFRTVLELMNENNSYFPYTIAKLAQHMKLHKIGELERVFNAQEEPSFEFIEHFCNTFGIDKNWLIHGQGAPYNNPDQTNFDPLDYFDEIAKENPNRIYFIMNDSEVGEAFILLELSDYKYKIIQRVWHVSSHVGGGGRSQIFGLYRLIKKLEDSGYGMKCGGRILSPQIFDRLLNGDVYPETVLKRPSQKNPWWDDFTDVYGKYPISSNYEDWYGKGFIYAQSVVREKLGCEKSANKSMQPTTTVSAD